MTLILIFEKSSFRLTSGGWKLTGDFERVESEEGSSLFCSGFMSRLSFDGGLLSMVWFKGFLTFLEELLFLILKTELKLSLLGSIGLMFETV